MRPIAMLSGLLLLIPMLLPASEFNGIKFMKISAADQAAVVKSPDGKLKLLKTGDMVDAETRIVAFEDNHVILEGPGEWGPIKYFIDVTAGQMHVTQMARRPLEKHQFLEGGEVESFNTQSR